MHTFDTIIIGAGPAGLSCAALLARRGRSVLVLEKNREIGPKVCAGGITWSGLRDAIPESLVERRFQEQRVLSRLQRVTIRAAVPMVVTVDRGRLGRWMRDQATAAGAEIKSGCRVEAIGAATVATAAGEFGYTHLVGADGSNSLVRRHLDLPRQRLGIGLQYWLEEALPDMEWHIDAGRFAGGYAWIFPHRHRCSVGIYAGRGLLPPQKLRARLLDWARERGLSLKGLQPEAYLINYDYRGSRFGKVHLVGDAAGLASPLTGEGIHPAILSGRAAAAAILADRSPETALAGLLAKHRLHLRYQRLASVNRLFGLLTGELFTALLRAGLKEFSSLEMGT